MIALLYQNFYLRHLISLMEMDVKDLFRDFWILPEIPDDADYKAITPIGNTSKNKEKSVKSFFQICVIRERKVFSELSFECLRGGQIHSRKGHGTSDHRDPIDGFAQKERGSN